MKGQEGTSACSRAKNKTILPQQFPALGWAGVGDHWSVFNCMCTVSVLSKKENKNKKERGRESEREREREREREKLRKKHNSSIILRADRVQPGFAIKGTVGSLGLHCPGRRGKGLVRWKTFPQPSDFSSCHFCGKKRPSLVARRGADGSCSLFNNLLIGSNMFWISASGLMAGESYVSFLVGISLEKRLGQD